MILLSLVVYDFCEISHLGGNASITEYSASTKTEQNKDDSSTIDLPDKSSIALAQNAENQQKNATPGFEVSNASFLPITS